MAGCGAAHRLHSSGVRSVMYDKNAYYGGHTSSHQFPGGWTFDEGPHVSFTKEKRIQELLAANIDGDFQTLATYVNNYWRGHWIKHPAQVNLHGLPPELIVRVLRDFIDAQHTRRDAKIANYEDWLRASYGDTFAETFPMEYTIKYHTTTASNMNTDWIGPRLYQANLEEVLRGALEPSTSDVHYISGFRYPTNGGFASYLAPFMRQTHLQLGHEVVRIDPRARTLHFGNGSTHSYSHLISSIPLPELVPMIKGAPDDVLRAAELLACTEVVIVCLGVNRPDLINAHWTYFYDRDFFFTRLSTPHLQSPKTVPPGCGSLQAECYYSRKYRPLDRKPEDCIEPVIKDLLRCGVLREDDQILFRHAMHIPYANVIFDLDCAAALATVHGYLEDIGVVWAGRYGDWAYIWTDQAFMSGENAAQKVLDGRVRRAG
jgi:protoporphyrinogen oxidase